MFKIIIFLVLIFTIIYFVTNIVMSKRRNGLVKFIIPIALTLIIVGVLFFILPRFGLNPFILFQTIISKIIPYLSMLRGIF
jgi:hypothetical protein